TRWGGGLKKLAGGTHTGTGAGSGIGRPRALTATGSVLASTAPRTNATLTDSAATAPATAATAAADAITRPTARTTTGRHIARRSRQASSSLAAYSNGGNTTRLMSSGGTCIDGVPGSMPTPTPTRTSKEGAGTLSRRAKAATTVANATKNTTVSTVRTQPTSPRRSDESLPTRLPGAPGRNKFTGWIILASARSRLRHAP